jgi:hypothetical protein
VFLEGRDTFDLVGFALSWIAVKDKPAARVLGELGLRDTHEREPLLWRGSREVPYYGAQLEQGWYVVVANGEDYFSNAAVLKVLSASCSSVSCFLEEHVMVSKASGWRGGKQLWSVLHDALNKGSQHLSTTGTPPAELLSIAKAQRALPAEAGPPWPPGTRVDQLFEVPIQLGERLTGFRHDRMGDRAFAVLARR